MNEHDVLLAVLGRQESYAVWDVKHLQGRLYSLTMKGEHHTAVLLITAFEYYTRRYHVAKVQPTLVICYEHDTVCPVPVLSTRLSTLAKAYELPEEMTTDIEHPRRNTKEKRVVTRTGSQVLLGMYLSGMQRARFILKDLPVPTRNRYLAKARALNKRMRGRPVGLPKKEE